MKPSVLLLLWHPNDSIAGGFVRVQEFLKYFGEIDLTIIDNSPTLIKAKEYKNIQVISYTTPKSIKRIYTYSYSFGRIFEWGYALVSLIRFGRRELKKRKYEVIYGPTGDNLHIFLAGVILKKMFPQKKLLLDVLNLEMPEGSIKQYYKTFKEKNVGTIEAFLKTYSLAFLLYTEKKLIMNCDFVVTVSPYMKKIISEFYPTKKIDFTSSGVDIPKGMNKYEKSKKIYDGIYVGRHTKDKGVFDLIQVWDKILAQNKNSHYVMAGACPQETKDQLVHLIKSKKRERDIKISGIVSEQEKWQLLGKSRIFFHLAYFEPLVPVITILEALAFGIPVIMYDVSAIDDYPFLRKNPAILIAKNKNINDVVKKTLTLLGNLEKNEKEIRTAAKLLAKQFSWKNVAEKEVKIIKKLSLNRTV